MEQRVRVDFVDHPSGVGHVVVVNGRPVADRFATVTEVVAFARSLKTLASYSGVNRDRVLAEGGQFIDSEENWVDHSNTSD